MNFAATRPYLYHLTAHSNLERIRETKTLASASVLMNHADRKDLLRLRRRNHESVTVNGRSILIRDQAPLWEGNMMIPGEYTFEDFIEHLNGRVFFWPGARDRPIPPGMRHFERYRDEKPTILRIEFKSLSDANGGHGPEFCRYNSGSPRCSRGKKIPRGPDTFMPESDFKGTPSQVVEVTFRRGSGFAVEHAVRK